MTGSAELAAGVAAGDIRSVARLISRLENRDPSAQEAMRVLLSRTGRALTIGVTGPPGSGKSSLVDRLIRELRQRGRSVGVIAVDPSSPFTGGAILGDRLRMQEHATDPRVFLRSLASRGHLGGLSKATGAAARVLDAAGYDVVIIETVGVGQSEVDVVRVADLVVLVSVPGLGDDIQTIKAGVMEIGDIFVVNKADREGADRVVREIRSMLETAATLAMAREETPAALAPSAAEVLHHGSVTGPGFAVPPTVSVAASALASAAAPGSAAPTGAAPIPPAIPSARQNGFALDETGHPVLPPVLKTVAATGEGCAELLDAILAHHAALGRSGLLAERRLAASRAEIRDLLQLRVAEFLDSGGSGADDLALAHEVLEKRLDSWEAADRLYESLFAAEGARGATRPGSGM